MQRLTTRYVESEDRIEVAGEVAAALGHPAKAAADTSGAQSRAGAEPGSVAPAVPGEPIAPSTVRCWLTQRLLLRLIPALCQWLESRSQGLTQSAASAAAAGVADFLQEVGQARARAQLGQESPVQAAHAEAWVVVSVDLSLGAQELALRLKAGEAQQAKHGAADPLGSSDGKPASSPNGPPQAQLVLSELALRQWLDILWGQWQRAEWPVHVWPLWMRGVAEPAASEAAGARVVH